MFGRNGEVPVPIIAPQSPGDCFDAALEAARIAVTYRTPVMLLSDGYLANGSEPWRIPDVEDRRIDPDFATGPNHPMESGESDFWPYLRDEETLARPWAIPGTPGLEHRIGGLEKGDGHGNISYDPANHDFMVRTRQAKVDRIADCCRRWRSTTPTDRPRCSCSAGVDVRPDRGRRTPRAQAGYRVAQAHLRHLNPFPNDLGEILSRYDRCWSPR